MKHALFRPANKKWNEILNEKKNIFMLICLKLNKFES